MNQDIQQGGAVVARMAHNHQAAGSNPAPAIICPSSPFGRGSGLRNHVMKVRILPGVLKSGRVGQLAESGVLKTSQSGFESQSGQINLDSMEKARHRKVGAALCRNTSSVSVRIASSTTTRRRETYPTFEASCKPAEITRGGVAGHQPLAAPKNQQPGIRSET